MTVIRKKTRGGFTTASNDVIRDDRLSLKARGLLLTLLSLPDDWEFCEAGLCAIIRKDGMSSIKSGLKELKEAGYLERTRKRTASGVFIGWEWTLYDYHRDTDFPTSDNLDQQNKDLTKEILQTQQRLRA